MMMAPGSTPNPPELSAASIDALRTALGQYLADPNAVAILQPTLQRVAAEAREKKMQAERLLVVLKDLWFALPPIRQATDIEQQNRQLQRVVTICIREYYTT